MQQYIDLLKDVLAEGRPRGDRTGTGTISIFSSTFKHRMSDGFPLLTTKKMFLRGIFHELRGFLNNDLHMRALIDENVKIWDGFRLTDDIGEYRTGDLNAPYGAGWRAFKSPDGDVDQIAYVLELLRELPESRRLLVSAWNPGWMPEETRRVDIPIEERDRMFMEQYPEEYKQHKIIQSYPEYQGDYNLHLDKLDEMGIPKNRVIRVSPQENIVNGKPCLTPCHWAFEFYTEIMTLDERIAFATNSNNPAFVKLTGLYATNKIDDCVTMHAMMSRVGVPVRSLSLKWHQRSVDTFLGLPFNIASYALLLQLVADNVGMAPGTLIGDLTNVHIYNNHNDQVNLQLTREPLPLPKLRLINTRSDIAEYQWSDIKLEGYQCYEKIEGKISV